MSASNSNGNLLSPIVDSVWDCSKLLFNVTKKALGLNTLDFNKFFKEVGLCNKSKEYPRFDNRWLDDYFEIYRFKCPVGIDVEEFKKYSSKLAHFMGIEEDEMKIKRSKFDVDVKVLIKEPRPIYNPEVHKIKGFKIPIGLDLDELEIRYWDLSDPANAHGYAAGTTRCGKSTLIRLITTMLIQKSVADVQLSWINIKKVDGNEFEHCKNTIHYTEDEAEANDILRANVNEMKRRYTLFSKHRGVKNIWNYRDNVGKMPIRLIIIEEIAGFEQDKEFHETLRLIAQQGAGAGILILAATQLPNKDVLPNLTKQNINTVFGGKCKDSIRSDIIIEDGELNKLRGKGHMKVFDCDDYGTEIQVLWIDDDMVYDIAQKNLKRQFKQNKRAIEEATSITHGDNKNIGL